MVKHNLIELLEENDILYIYQYVDVTYENMTEQFEIRRDGELNVIQIKPLFKNNTNERNISIIEQAFSCFYDDVETWDSLNKALIESDLGEPIYMIITFLDKKFDNDGEYSYTNEEEVEIKYEVSVNDYTLK